MTTRARVPLDNFVQNGDHTLKELKIAIAAVNGGNDPGIVEIIRDPATGRLVNVVLDFPDSVSVNAIDAINANVGVPTTVAACPQQLFANDLSDSAPDGMVFSGTLAVDDHEITCFTDVVFNVLGLLNNVGAGNVYTDFAELLSAFPVLLLLTNNNLTTDLVIATGSLTLNLSATKAVTVSLTADLVLPKRSAGFKNFKQLYIDVDGKLYLRAESVDGSLPTTLTYEETCAAGAL